MTQVITDHGFVADDWTGEVLDVAADANPNTVPLEAAMIRVDFPSSADGRGFTIARMLRLRGYRGRLRARGPLLSDQYAMARRVGFDEVEVPDALAARQPEPEWLFRANWQAHDYQARLRGDRAAL